MELKREKIWLNGKLAVFDKISTSLLNHGMHYGSSVFEGIRCYNTDIGPSVFRLDDHLKRFLYSAKCIGMKIDFSIEDMKKGILNCIIANNLKECYIRPLAFFSKIGIGILPQDSDASIVIICKPFSMGKEDGIKVSISKYIRPHPDSIIIDAKISGHYVNSIMAGQNVKADGFDEAILLDRNGNVAEGPGENLFLVKKGVLYTPKKGNILPGITRDSIMKLAKDRKIKVVEKVIKPQDFKFADELFFTGTAVEVWPILQCGDYIIKNGTIGPITKMLKEDYKNVVRGRTRKYKKWLTYQ